MQSWGLSQHAESARERVGEDPPPTCAQGWGACQQEKWGNGSLGVSLGGCTPQLTTRWR